MKIDIWSDVRCPFCYIGKRRFEAALAQFEHKENIEVSWHSFELDPAMETQPDKNIYDYLAEIKGQSKEWSVQMHSQVTNTAKELGLDYNFDQAVVANSFNAHRLIQLAKTRKLDDAAEERLFRAYFTEGKNIDDENVLRQIGVEIGLDSNEVEHLLTTDAFSEEVHTDEAKAQLLGIRGVPFFVINDKYGVSGAQPQGIFLQALNMAWKEYAPQQIDTPFESENNVACPIDGQC